MPLYIGNLTNIMIGDSYKAGLFRVHRIHILPTIAAGVVIIIY